MLSATFFRIHREHPDHAMCRADVVNHAVTSPLTAPRCFPAKLADTARARDYRSSHRIRHQRCLQCQVLIIRHVAENELRKEARLDEAEYHDYTAMPYNIKRRSSHYTLASLCPLACSPIRGARLWPDGSSPGFPTSMYPYVAPHTAKIHTLITLGIRDCAKALVFQLRKHRPGGFDSHRPLHFWLPGMSLRCPRTRLSLSPSSHSLNAATVHLVCVVIGWYRLCL